ncbi:hypothetical protein HIM_06493 [Hirsutella minnesotensis 3608]|uniref:non-specific serine/threonine protein kinase n=1 Tax=Hirsutella minnesotensis 3608 TaxID=1043627 RepID=A0A0F8A4R6_9HYPO|nr:hypothetical protein HIM_06493 [Hirsutella minnesotensis 3608]
MAQNFHPKTLFHLVPANDPAHKALLHPDNRSFVSRSDDKRREPGLEVGFHVPSKSRGHVITRLGRDADLILNQSTPKNPMSAVHVAFEVNAATCHVLLSVRSKRPSSVNLELPAASEKAHGESITGDSVIIYGQTYLISIASYEFILVWRTMSATVADNINSLKTLTMQGFQSSQQLAQNMRSRDRPTDVDVSEAQSWHITRLNTARLPHFRDVEQLRTIKASGAFGNVFKAVDRSTGHNFAIKVVNLAAYINADIETARALLHKEIKFMERFKHEHIIELLGYQRFDTPHPEIFMPLRDGTLGSLVKSHNSHVPLNRESVSLAVLEQMLGALDYLANANIVHRDIKPDNILYSNLGNGYYHFQLANFGLANYRSIAQTFCGTGYFQAPEFWPYKSNVIAGQSPKMDIWSLFATIVAFHSAFTEFPPATGDYLVVLGILRKKG